MNTVANVLALLAEHAGLVELLVDVLARGGDRERIARALREIAVEASDAAMHEELGEK